MNIVEIGEFVFDLSIAKEKIKELNVKKIMLQLPDGLRRKSYNFISHFDVEVEIWGGTCYGACDLPNDIDDADLLVHIGHSEIPNLEVDYPVVYVEGRSKRLTEIPDRLFDLLDGTVGLYATVQYLGLLDKISHELKNYGFDTTINEGDDRIKYPGQVLGCNYSVKVEKADSHLYVGTGDFHPLGLSLALDDKVIKFNPTTGDFDSMEEKKNKTIRRRYAIIANAKGFNKCGIIVSRKKGQIRKALAQKLVKKCEDCVISIFDDIDNNLVDDFEWDLAVNTACPRIALDDSINFKTRILTPTEFMILIGELGWEDWNIDEIH